MTSAPAFTTSFLPSLPPTFRARCTCASQMPLHMTQAAPFPPASQSSSSRSGPSYTRRAVVSLFGATFGLSAFVHIERAMAASDGLTLSRTSLQSIRARVDDIDPLIAAAKWDSVRTVLASRPVVGVKDVCNQLLNASSQDAGGAIVGLREDLQSAIRLLDTSVYANVFIGEDRQILGTKVDYDVPKIYLGDVKDALDSLIDIASS